jgi:putative transposase
MKKAYRYRIYPTKKQIHVLQEQLALCAELYNAALQERRDAWRMCGKSITFTQQSAQLPHIKQVRPEYEGIYSQVLQDVLHRVDKAFQAFFRRVKAGQTPGYPRFKSRSRYGSLTYPQFGFGLDEQGKLSLAKVGHLKLVMHRPFKGIVKTATITQSATGKWYVSFSCDEVEPDILPPSELQVGLDVGLSTFAYLSTGEQIENPRFFRVEEKSLARVQPAYTSQTCSGCGCCQEILLSVRVYECPHCGLSMDRDHNASVNILQKAVGRHGRVIRRAPSAREPLGVVTFERPHRHRLVMGGE